MLLLFLAGFLLMGLYYILKPVREALILSQAGAVVKSYSSAAQALLFVAVVPIYSAFSARVTRVWLLSGMTLFFISNLVLFIIAGNAGLHVGVVYYIWLGIFNFMVVSQFWAFANDIYNEEQGKRLFPIVGIGGTLGAWLGARWTGEMFASAGPYLLMTIASVLLGVFILMMFWINRRVAKGSKHETEKAEQKLNKEGGFSLVMKSRYLRLVAFHVLLLNLVNTIGEFILGSIVEHAAIVNVGAGVAHEAARGDYIGAFYGSFFGWVNLATFLIQSFLVSRFIKKLGIRGTLFIGPIISAVTYSLSAIRPTLQDVQYAKMAENSNDYSTNNTIRQALFLPMSRDVKYKAKAAIDTFFGRSGDALQAVVVFIGANLSLAVPAFAVVNLGFVAIWLAVCGGISKEFKKLTSVE